MNPSAEGPAYGLWSRRPILVFMYGRLAKTEERDMLAEFGDEYRRYLDAVPAFFPDLFSFNTKGDSP